MSELKRDEGVILARLDTRKCALFALLTLALAIIPNLPGADGGGLTGILYTTPFGVTMRWLATAVLLSMGGALVLGILRAWLVSPAAVWLNGSQLSWGLVGTDGVHLSDIKSVVHVPARRALKIETHEGRTKWLPVRGLRSEDAPDRLLDKIRGAILA